MTTPIAISLAAEPDAAGSPLTAETDPAPLVVGSAPLTVSDVMAVARHGRAVVVSSAADVRDRIVASRRALDAAVANAEPVYGVTTRFGGLADEILPPGDAERLQERALWIHATACGPPIPDSDVRAAMLARLASHVQGASAVSPALIQRLADALNLGITPVVREFGSIGASGDLVPLAYIAGGITGHAARFDVRLRGKQLASRDALARVGLEPLALAAKDGLAMINGTSASAGVAAGAIHDAQRLLALSFGVHALAVQALGASVQPFHPAIHGYKPHPGQRLAASIMSDMIAGGVFCRDEPLRGRRATADTLIQDRYSVRCLPQFVGPTVDAIAIAARQVETELNAVTDNPLVDPGSGAILHGGNFLGQYIAVAMDAVRLHLSLLSQHLDAQLALLVSPAFSNGLPASLVGNTADPLNMGLKGVQLTGNSLMPLLASMAAPVVDRVPTHAEQFNQNVNSQSWNAAQLTSRALRIYEHYLSVALLMAVQAVDLRSRTAVGHCDAREGLGPGTRPLYAAVRRLLDRQPDRARPLVHDDDDQRLDAWLAVLHGDIVRGGRIDAAMADVTVRLAAHGG